MPLAFAHSSEATTIAPAPSLTPGALPAVWVPSLVKMGGSLASASSEASRRGASSCSTTVSPFLPLMVTGTISSSRRPSSTASKKASWLRSDHLSMSARVISSSSANSDASWAMCLPVKALVRPSWIIDVERLAVAHAEAEARLGQHVRGVGHGLHAAADADLEVTRADGLVEHPDRADARRADLVDGLGGDLLGDAALDGRLARGDLPLAGLEDGAHHDVVHVAAVYARALERRLDGDAAELGGLHRRQAAAQLPHGGPGRTQDHGLGHGRER